MKKILIVGTAPNKMLDKYLEKIKKQLVKTKHRIYLLLTKKYENGLVDDYLNIESDSIKETLKLTNNVFDDVIVCLANSSLAYYKNVFFFLKNNNINKINIYFKDEIYEKNLDTIINFISDENIVYLNPDEIKFGVKGFKPIMCGENLDGDWDLDKFKFEDEIVFYNSFKEHFYEDVEWEKTEYFSRNLKQILEDKKNKWGCKNKEEFLERCRHLDELFLEMKKNGWVQNENSDFLTINIDRNGHILFNDGRHRLTFAKLLKINKIPAKILVRHKKWADFKKEIEKYAFEHKGKIYTEIDHIDLKNIEYVHDGRYEVIKSHISDDSKSVLDIGSHWGYFCSRLEKDLNKECVAVEVSEKHFYFLEKLKTAMNCNFNAVNENIFSFIDKNYKFDVIIALNIFHHFLKTEHLFNKFLKLLNKIESREMFFQSHKFHENQMKNSFFNLKPQEFAEFIVKNSKYNNFQEIGDFNGRKLFHIYK